MKAALVPCVGWVKQGVPKARPEKVKLAKEDLQQLLEGATAETSEQSDNDEEEQEPTDQGDQPPQKKGLRGSAASKLTEKEAENEPADKYKMADYDKEEDDSGTTSAMSGIACFASPMEDPYLHGNNEGDSDEDEDEKEDFELKPTDNLLVTGRIVKDEFNLEVWVYNQANDDWYTHHDYMLDAPPLCIETISFDPGADNPERRGNLVAVGTMDAVVNIWDLDIVNAVEPVITLGDEDADSEGPMKKRKKRDGSQQGHSDAVLDLAWNRRTEHVLASASADHSVILWDLEEAKISTVLTHHKDKVQSIAWHPGEDTLLLSGAMDGSVAIVDGRSTDVAAEWKFSEVEVEEVIWNHFNPFYFLVGGDDGMVRYCDSRKANDAISTIDAHGKAGVTGLALSHSIEGLLTTVGADETVKIWKLDKQGNIAFVADNKPRIGPLHCVRFCPDAGTVVAVSGEKGDFVRLVDLAKNELVKTAFEI